MLSRSYSDLTFNLAFLVLNDSKGLTPNSYEASIYDATTTNEINVDSSSLNEKGASKNKSRKKSPSIPGSKPTLHLESISNLNSDSAKHREFFQSNLEEILSLHDYGKEVEFRIDSSSNSHPQTTKSAFNSSLSHSNSQDTIPNHLEIESQSNFNLSTQPSWKSSENLLENSIFVGGGMLEIKEIEIETKEKRIGASGNLVREMIKIEESEVKFKSSNLSRRKQEPKDRNQNLVECYSQLPNRKNRRMLRRRVREAYGKEMEQSGADLLERPSDDILEASSSTSASKSFSDPASKDHTTFASQSQSLLLYQLGLKPDELQLFTLFERQVIRKLKDPKKEF